MKKRFILSILSLMILNQAILPVVAVTETNNKNKTTKVSIRTKNNPTTSEDRLNYINEAWWKNFNDAQLSEYIYKAIAYNHDLKIATMSTEEYYQAVKLQFSNQLPQAGIGFAPGMAKFPGTTDYHGMFAMPALVNYEADIFLKNRDKTTAAKKIYETAIQDERAAYISVVSGVAVTYLNIVKLDYIIDVQKDIVADRETIYNLMLKRNHLGLTSTSDTLIADKAFVNATIELTELEKQREKLLHQLAVMIGESPENIDQLERTSLKELVFDGTIPDEISSDIIINRPDYLKAEKFVEKAGLDVRVAKKEFLPTINLSGLAVFNSNNLNSMFSTKGMLLGLGAGAFLPVFQGGARVANLRMKKATQEKAVQNYLKTNLTAIQEVNDALVTIKKDDEKYNKVLKQKDNEQKDYNYNLKKYEKGLISKLDLIQSRESLLYIDKTEQSEKVQLYVDYIGLYKATGAKI